MAEEFSVRDKSILVGLYFSKFDEEAIHALGFERSREAFNTIGYAIGSKPASIKNYRDEFDPYFPNPRKGWHKRELRDYCRVFLEQFGQLPFQKFTDLIKSFVYADFEIQKFIAQTEKRDFTEAVARRQLTGIAAEEYFRANFQDIPIFGSFTLTDTTKNACGFDFKLDNADAYYCVEVKGLNAARGSVSMTEKEYITAQNLKERYCLFIVSNFIEKPLHAYYLNPLESQLSFSKVERQIIQTSYNTHI